MGALASSGSPQGGVEGRVGAVPQVGPRAELVGSSRTNFPHCRDPFPTSFTGPLSSQPPSDAGNQVREGEGRLGWGQLFSPHLPFPTGCLFAAPAYSAPPNRLRLRRKRQVWGPLRPRAAETSRDHLAVVQGKGLPPMLGQRRVRVMRPGVKEPALGRAPQFLPSVVYMGTHLRQSEAACPLFPFPGWKGWDPLPLGVPVPGWGPDSLPTSLSVAWP
jgi:hypothetical protein